MKNEVVNKHDVTFKEVFSQKRIAKDFIENNIPKEALDIIDMESLELQKDTFINKELQENFSDLIYRVKINNKDAYISFLIEHKSYKDKLAIFQLNKYMLESWMTIIQKENKEELPIIIPMLIYHGKEKWNIRTDIRDMIPDFYQLPEYFKERVPVFKYDFFNIGEYKENDFQKLTRLTAMMLKAFKYSFEEDLEVVLENFLLALDEVQKEESLETIIYYGEIYLRYIELTNSDATEEDIKEEIRRLDGKGAVTMSILERRELLGMEKGLQEGMQKGLLEGRQEGMQKRNIEIAKNLLKEGVEIALVVKATGLSKSEVEELKEQLDN
ncbi:Rpn family recombination-promoting nuclease/putative transposase [Tissierella pigra]|uniref:Rpn family recombination-promoting nuclease/putative transposase n=2 Tax=Tissierella pigra TaxID=2607614 RepID=A0A6N7XH42_9FIRM|nr:Rpn family recombination-promoting nuclease/putative transposase [Tissierella pigra]MBU5426765.1 Rpn family recombination-promoting nuclease/putative transposase [Tissierella pigra]MSU01361.1 Rpn family recombination-promoting nuclease/putative transposase [Tissierella pigra]